jgi:hypothetical protein
MQLGLNLNELYDMTLYELRETLISRRKGLAYQMWKQAVLVGRLFNKDFPQTPEDASPELYPPKKTYKMPAWMMAKYYKRGMK